MNLTTEEFTKNLKNLISNPSEQKFLLAISGGVDSMVLLYYFILLKFDFQVVHINYHFRGENSNLDQKLVENLCKKHHIKFHLKEVTEEEKTNMKSLQNWARNIRYSFFFKILNQEKLDFLVTAHHLNDELETFFINLSRGSGIKGLSGIPRNENRIIRPLLNFTKQEIYHFALSKNIDFREDESNQKNDYLRNKIRNQLTPKLLEIFPNFLNQFSTSINHLHNLNQYFQSNIDGAFLKSIVQKNDQECILNKTILYNNPTIITEEVIRKFGFTTKEIQKIINAENGKMFRSSTYELFVQKNTIRLVKRVKKIL